MTEYYPHLDLTELRLLACKWSKNYPIIDKVSLFRSESNDSNTVYLLHVTLKKREDYNGIVPFDTAYRSYERDCIDGDYLFKGIPRIYKNQKTDWQSEWMILSPWESEPDEDVIKESRYVLFEDLESRKRRISQIRSVASEKLRENTGPRLANEYPFSELNIPRLECFSAQLANKYPAITRVTLHHSALDEAKYVLVLEVDKDSRAMWDWAGADWVCLRGIAWFPEEIRDHEEDWIPWTKEKGEILSGELVIDEGHVLYEREEATSVDEFIRSLKVEVVNDSEISIQNPGKSPITYDCKKIGFRNAKTKPWELLIEALQGARHIIDLPVRTLPDGRQNNEYQKVRKNLGRLNKKLLEYLQKEFRFNFPKGYKLYERDKSEGNGVYRFKFKTQSNEATTRFEKMPKDTLLKRIKELAQNHKESRERNEGIVDGKLLTEFDDACMVAFRKKWITKKQIEELLKDKNMFAKGLCKVEQDRYDYVAE